jgi:hypothetical protein
MLQKERYIFYITNPYKDKTIQFSFHTDVTIKYFTEFIKEEFMYLEPNNTIEIIENIQPINIQPINIQPININNINNLQNINYPETSTLREIFGDRWQKTSFYITLNPYTKLS